MKILHLIASIDPTGGGPLEYARIVADEHSKAGHKSVFVSLDVNGASLTRNFCFELHATGPVSGLLRRTPRFGETVARLASSCDAAVVHGLWNYASIGAYRALRGAGLPWVIFPHGMLDPYFSRAKPLTHWVKMAYWLLWQGRMLTDASAVLFTCAEEQRLARGSFLLHQNYQSKVVSFCAADQRLPVKELTNGRAEMLALLPNLAKPYWLFLSRIHPKKAIDILIQAYAKLSLSTDCPDLVIAGPDSDGWQNELERLVRLEGVSSRVHFPGMLRGFAKAAAFAGADAFILPSHQENFGLVVAEALSAGTPVLISDKVNIWREVVAAGAGLVGSDTVAGTADLLRQYNNISPADRCKMRICARSCFEVNFSSHAAANNLLDILAEAKKC